jgi:hypothetical protein
MLEHKETFNTLCNRKSIDPKSFASNGIQLSDNLSKHVAWAFQNIYKFPYPFYYEVPYPQGEINNRIARFYHGIQHVTRSAMHVPVFANLYRLKGSKEALELTDEDIHLIQIATLFHDSARESEGEDRWDYESGTMLYKYLSQVLKVDKAKAKKITEATANKDASPKDPEKPGTGQKKYHHLIETAEGEIIWQEAKETPPKNIYQKLIHDADCLEIRRVRDPGKFDARYLDFYHDFGKDPDTVNIIDQLIHEEVSLLYATGDLFRYNNHAIKEKFENENCYQAVKAVLDDPNRTKVGT